MRFIRNLSLEVVFGAVLYQSFLYKVYFHSIPSIVEIAILAVVVWFLYLLDRQVDNIFQSIQDERHRIHLQYRRFFLVLIGILGVFIFCLLPFQNAPISFAGFSLAFFVLVYAYAWHKGVLRSEKELFTAILYGLGVSLVVWVREPSSVLLVLPLIALAYQNLCYFSIMESPSDFYASRLRKTEWILLGLLCGIYAVTKDLFIVLPFLVTFVLTFLLSRQPHSERMRIWGELAFWSPLIYLVYGVFSA
jgi:Na+/H+ antiporter NhaD/arsenite permease-like protein